MSNDQFPLNNAAAALHDWVEVTKEGGGKMAYPRALESLRRDLDVKSALGAGAVLAIVPLVRDTEDGMKRI